MYREGKYEEALDFYTEAFFLAKTKPKPQRVALHSNRAACYLKLQDFKKASEECTSVLELDHNHTGALMLRAQTLVTLKEYHSALFDVNRLIELNPSSEVYKNLQAILKSQLVVTSFSFILLLHLFNYSSSLTDILIIHTVPSYGNCCFKSFAAPKTSIYLPCSRPLSMH
ncbi:unnamed protein product [Fraxinus pennsylvanica]|uniref:Uncharacterized protein n=1 Tax=Fraxinus pennsylvanica TaxID=56036 RepID=A0AAD1YT16_9LAMI|nr:unnamed protein product [Fraxinus pennsylvanica]